MSKDIYRRFLEDLNISRKKERFFYITTEQYVKAGRDDFIHVLQKIYDYILTEIDNKKNMLTFNCYWECGKLDNAINESSNGTYF